MKNIQFCILLIVVCITLGIQIATLMWVLRLYNTILVGG